MALCVQRCNTNSRYTTDCYSCDDDVDQCQNRHLQAQDDAQYRALNLPHEQSNSLLMRVFSISVTAAVSIFIGSLLVSLGFVFSIVHCLCGPRDGITPAASSPALKRRSSRGVAVTSSTSASVLVTSSSSSGSPIGVSPTSSYHVSKPFVLDRPSQHSVLQSPAVAPSTVVRQNRASGEQRNRTHVERSASRHYSSVAYSCGHQRQRPLHLATPVLHAAKA